MPSLDKFIVRGGNRLQGNITVSGAKNASLALMPATLLASGVSRLSNTPRLRDISTMSTLLETMGVRVKHPGTVLELDTREVKNFEAPYELVKKMRASFYVLGPLLGRFGEARVSYPGGCAWGPRPVDLHLKALEQLGATIEIEGGYVLARTKRLRGADITFDISSVGATGNTLMAAVLAKGTTVIRNAATEPEITQLAGFLSRMGARIDGIGSNCMTIEGVDELHAADDSNIPDRIEAGTFLAAAAATGGSITLENVSPQHLTAVLAKFRDAGCDVSHTENSISLNAPDALQAVNVSTAIYPGFPTDMQAQWMALMTKAPGTTTVTDTVYFDRFNHVPELQRLGARIEVTKNTAIIRGVERLNGATVMSTDLRASASLIIAGLMAESSTEILRVYHIDRGYEAIELKLRNLGADIQRVDSEDY
ncbi:MAG: UDP-N-acetylglucosamine 1-carboxyvinyltransferase [Ignavibacteria bacterium]|nr:MAG: UDP-N-acetylglucosamine 1-carboxyvinyltransferase [Ignavibacteria bacterium]